MRAHSDMALEYFFEQPLLFLFNGLANLQLKNYEEAASSLEYGLAMTGFEDDLKGDFYSLLGDTYHYLNNHRQSDQYYEKALEINPENATVLNNYSYHLAVRKRKAG
jgi:Tfp pilus assembly protein PilF